MNKLNSIYHYCKHKSHENKKHVFAGLTSTILVIHFVMPELETIATVIVGVITVEF